MYKISIIGVIYFSLTWDDIFRFIEYYMANLLVIIKDIMQGKLIAVAYTLRTYWNQFSLGGICKEE